MNTLLADLRTLEWQQAVDQALTDYRSISAHLDTITEKRAHSETLRAITDALNITHGTLPGGIPNAPGPLASTLTGGLVGAGLGYGAGMLGEQFMPAHWQRGRLRKTLAVLGGLGGAVPGMSWAGANLMTGRNWNDNSLTAGQPLGNVAPFKGTHLRTEPETVRPPLQHLNDLGRNYGLFDKVSQQFRKLAQDYGASGVVGVKPVNVNRFNQVIWDDPRIANELPIQARAAATGLVAGAAELSGNNSGWVTPMDIGRMTAGMGVGYMSGALVGKGLGLLMGMPEETQETLKNTGFWAGAVGSLISTAFGG